MRSKGSRRTRQVAKGQGRSKEEQIRATGSGESRERTEKEQRGAEKEQRKHVRSQGGVER